MFEYSRDHSIKLGDLGEVEGEKGVGKKSVLKMTLLTP